MILTDEQEHIIRCEENEFPKLFSSYKETEYGILFFDEENKDSHDSNHAVIYPEHIDNLGSVLKNITAFYTEKHITPTIYHPFVKDYFLENKDAFVKHGFKITFRENHQVFLLSEKSVITPNNSIDIRCLTKWDKRITRDILIPNDERYEAPVGEATMRHKGSYLFAGYKNDKAVVYAIFHVSKFGCTRFDYIDTAEDERGKGYARQLAHQVMNFCLKEKLPLCVTWFANPTSERLNYEAGFRPTDLWLEAGYAVLEDIK